MNYSDSDVIILMDDDVSPQVVGWEFQWAEAVRHYGHANHAFYREMTISGACQAANPGMTQALGGQCMAFSREALGAVGFMDPRFARYGHEPTELTRRALRAGYGGLVWDTERGRQEYFFVIDGGVSVVPAASRIDADSLAANALLLERFRRDPIYRHAWRDDDEMKLLIGEIEASGLSRCGKAVAIPYGFDPALYKSLNRDLASHPDPLGHYVWHGHLENRPIHAPSETVADHWVNVSEHCATLQSSICEHSFGSDVASDSAGAVNGRFTGQPQFHTSNEPEPWWMVDLGSIQSVGLIRIFNRIDSDVYRDRFRSFRIEGSADGINWLLIVREDLADAPGGLDGRFYELAVTGEPRCRFVRIVQQLRDFLHLDQVQIFARRSTQIRPPAPDTDAADDCCFWTLTTATGQELSQRLSDGRLVSYKVPPIGVTPIYVVTSRKLPELLFVLAADAANAPLKIHSNGEPDGIIPYFIERQADGLVALRHPRSNRYVSVRPADDAEVVEVASDRVVARGWEHFRLEERREPFRGRLIQTARAFANAVSQMDFAAASLADWVRGSSTETVRLLFKPLLRMLPPVEFERFATICLDPASKVTTPLAGAFADDPWLAEAIPATLEWLADRHCRDTAVASALCDGMGLPGFPADQPISFMLASLMRRHVAARRRLCILATARDEGPYLLEWIAYHRSLGVEHFFIYTNDITDGSDTLLKELSRDGYVTHIENICQDKALSPQLKAYGHALSCLPDILDFEWTAIIDLDEYITLEETENRTIPQILDSSLYAGGGGVALNWRMFGPADAELPVAAPIIARSWRCEPALNNHIKTIIRTRQCNWSGPHAPEWTRPEERIVLNPKGEDYRPNKRSASTSFSDTPCYETMWVSHYFYKSFPEFVWKFSRNRGDTGAANRKSFDVLPHFCEEFVRFSREENTVADLSMKRRIPECLKQLQLLRSRPGIARTERQVINEVNTQLAGYLGEIAAATNLPLADGTRQWFMRAARQAIADGPVFDILHAN